MTKLEAVNLVLRGVGMAGTSALDTDGNSDAAQAERILDAVEQEVQEKGWHYNTRREVTLTPDGDDHILLPDGTITIDADCEDAWRNVTQRGGRLYDLDNNTDEFSGPLTVTIVERLNFGCIPPPVQHYIAHEAAYKFNETPRGHPSRRGTLYAAAQAALAKANRYTDETGDVNILKSADARKVRGNRFRIWE